MNLWIGKEVKINCPVLYLQKSHDIQGNMDFVFSDPIDPRGGLPSELPLGKIRIWQNMVYVN